MDNNSVSTTYQYAHEFAIIETEDGLTVVMLERDVPAEETATRHNGMLMDPGPYKSYDEAFDAIVDLMAEREE